MRLDNPNVNGMIALIVCIITAVGQAASFVSVYIFNLPELSNVWMVGWACYAILLMVSVSRIYVSWVKGETVSERRPSNYWLENNSKFFERMFTDQIPELFKDVLSFYIVCGIAATVLGVILAGGVGLIAVICSLISVSVIWTIAGIIVFFILSYTLRIRNKRIKSVVAALEGENNH